MTTETIIIGAGQAGLSLSHHLTRLGRDHVVLERGDIGERWRSERWASLRLLTPNGLNTLDGSPDHADRDGYVSTAGFAEYLERYALATGAPVRANVDVVGVERGSRGFRVRTDAADWHAGNIVIATGFADVPHRPRSAAAAPRHLHQIDASHYRAPGTVAGRGVLVVGSGPSGQQIAAELRRAGRHVVIAAGRHGRLPRRYFGQDIWHWLNEIGDVDRVIEEPVERASARRVPSLALTGANGGEQLDLGVLHALGVVVAGRLTGFDRGRALFADDLPSTVANADDRMRSVLDRIDAHLETNRGDGVAPERIPRVQLPSGPRELDLANEGVSTVIWATGYRRDYRWLHLPALDADGELEHRRGITSVPASTRSGSGSSTESRRTRSRASLATLASSRPTSRARRRCRHGDAPKRHGLRPPSDQPPNKERKST